MSLRYRVKKLEQVADAPGQVDYVAILNAARQRKAAGVIEPPTPCPLEWEHSRDPLKKRLFQARRRVGFF